jgi:L-histidine N-alpha-methyltransferase
MSDAEELRRLSDGLLDTPSRVDSKYFYDQRGSELFDEITSLKEYYPTRTEHALLEKWSEPLIRRLEPAALLELGAGSARKTRLLLSALEQVVPGATYIPLDVSASFLGETARELRAEFPSLRVTPLAADFTEVLELREPLPRPTLFALLGSTIGNFPPARAAAILRHAVDHMDADDHLLLGADLRPGPSKSKTELEAAYNDPRGVTADFNLNVLNALNERFGLDFDISAFEHVAFYDDIEHRIEMHLRATTPTSVTLPGTGTVRFEKSETVRTEISCKYDRPTIDEIFEHAGLEVTDWFDAEGRYALVLGRRVR